MAIDTTAMTARDWLTPAAAARRLNLTPASVRKLMREQRLTHTWTPLGRLVQAASVEAMARARAAGSPAPPEAA